MRRSVAKHAAGLALLLFAVLPARAQMPGQLIAAPQVPYLGG